MPDAASNRSPVGRSIEQMLNENSLSPPQAIRSSCNPLSEVDSLSLCEEVGRRADEILPLLSERVIRAGRCGLLPPNTFVTAGCWTETLPDPRLDGYLEVAAAMWAASGFGVSMWHIDDRCIGMEPSDFPNDPSLHFKALSECTLAQRAQVLDHLPDLLSLLVDRTSSDLMWLVGTTPAEIWWRSGNFPSIESIAEELCAISTVRVENSAGAETGAEKRKKVFQALPRDETLRKLSRHLNANAGKGVSEVQLTIDFLGVTETKAKNKLRTLRNYKNLRKKTGN